MKNLLPSPIDTGSLGCESASWNAFFFMRFLTREAAHTFLEKTNPLEFRKIKRIKSN
jgi:hypothetical protein